MINAQRKSPGCNRGSLNIHNIYTVDSAPSRQQKQGFFDRSNLPTPHAYLQSIRASFRVRGDVAHVKCVFHTEKNASLLVNLTDGHFKCMACGAKGRDILAFHQRLTGLGFKQAATDLGAWEGGVS